MNLLQTARTLGVLVASGILAACQTIPTSPAPPAASPVATLCQPVAAEDPAVGNWLSKRSEKGVAGELRTLFTLQADGKMLYTEQLKRPRQPSQGLSESGCWWREGNQLVLKTLESNGVKVDDEDPIYVNRYTVQKNTPEQLHLTDETGLRIKADKTSPGYRLPF